MGLTDAQVSSVWNAVEEQSSPTHHDIFTALLEMYSDVHGALYWGEKTPAHLEYLDDIAATFPEAVFLVMIRDPRDVSLSLRKTPWNQKRTVFDHAGRWARYARCTERFRRENSSQLKTIKYERFIESPKSVLQEVCGFLGCTFSTKMIAQEGGKEANLDPLREPWKEGALRPIDPTNKEKWRDEMTVVEQQIVQWRAGREMKALEYDLEELPFEVGMIGPLIKLLMQTILGKAHRVRHHVLEARAARKMPWRSHNS